MLRLALAQLDLTVGALAENRKRIADACADAARAGAELVLAPELAISGYPPEDLLLRPAFLRACHAEAERLAAEVEIPLVVGCPWLDGDRVRNAALVLTAAASRRATTSGSCPITASSTRSARSRRAADRCTSTRRRRARADDLRGRLAPGRRRRGGRARSQLRAQHLRLAVPPRQGPGARGDAGDARAGRPLRRGLLQPRGRPGRARLRWSQRRLRAGRDVLARAASFAEELLVCDVDLDASVHERLRDRASAAAGATGCTRRSRSSWSSGGDQAPVTPSIAPPPAGKTAELWERAAPRTRRLRAQERLRARGARPLGRNRLGAGGGPGRRHARRRSRRGRLDADAIQQRRTRAATPGSSPSGSGSPSASSRSRICASPSRARCPARADWRPRTCRPASAACC